VAELTRRPPQRAATPAVGKPNYTPYRCRRLTPYLRFAPPQHALPAHLAAKEQQCYGPNRCAEHINESAIIRRARSVHITVKKFRIESPVQVVLMIFIPYIVAALGSRCGRYLKPYLTTRLHAFGHRRLPSQPRAAVHPGLMVRGQGSCRQMLDAVVILMSVLVPRRVDACCQDAATDRVCWRCPKGGAR
jgi:hypothetical protein